MNPRSSTFRCRPNGQASTEYVLVASAIMGIWLFVERSPLGLSQAMIDLFRRYAFSISLPW